MRLQRTHKINHKQRRSTGRSPIQFATRFYTTNRLMNNQNVTILKVLCLALVVAGFSMNAGAQSSSDQLRERYIKPENVILEQAAAPRYKNVTLENLSPDRKYYASYIKNDNNVSIEQFANKFYNLGGLAIDPAANRKQYLTNETPDFTSRGSGTGMLLTDARSGETKTIHAPKDTHISNLTWSPDGSKIAYFAHYDRATHIYVAEAGSGKTKRITNRPVMATLNAVFSWSADSKFIFTTFVPQKRGAEPQEPFVDLPQIRVSTTDVNRLRTSPALLQNPYEAELLKYYTTGQLARIEVANSKILDIGTPELIREVSVSPDGEHLLVTRLKTPFSYIVPVNSYGWIQEVWNLRGEAVATVQASEDREGIPDYNVLEYENRSQIAWRPDGRGLSMILSPEKKEEDKENSEAETENKEEKTETWQVIRWEAPFADADMNVVYENKKKFNNVSYAPDSEVLFITEGNFRNQTVYAVYPDNPDTTYTILKQNSSKFYDNPGNLVQTVSNTGFNVVLTSADKNHVYLSGVQYDKNPEENAPRPFLDKVHIRTGKKDRVFQSPAAAFEEIVSILDEEAGRIVIKRQTGKTYPNFWSMETTSGAETKLTSNQDYNEAVTVNTIRKRIKVKRADGFEFWAEIIMPGNWNGKPLPGFIWHYPTEFDSQKAYDEAQRTYNKNEYPPLNQDGWPQRSPEVFTQIGFAIIKADWPIYSKDGGPNDAFVYSVQQNSAAVIDSAAALGYVDRHRMAIGGHSYGGFGTAHAMIWTSYFKAGIAGDANFNRTLTPFGFQREPRDLWRGKTRYLEMSPILWADRLDGALLIYSGADDENVGTAPVMSWQMFDALNALGKTTALHMYPYAQHHTNAKEIILDRWARWAEWLNHYVKNSGEHTTDIEIGNN